MSIHTRSDAKDLGAGPPRPSLRMNTNTATNKTYVFTPNAETIAHTKRMLEAMNSPRQPMTPNTTPVFAQPTPTRPSLKSRHSFYTMPAEEVNSVASRSSTTSARELRRELKEGRDVGFVVELETIMEGLEERAGEEKLAVEMGVEERGRRRSRF